MRFLVFLFVLAWAPIAAGQTADDKAAASALFAEGKRLLSENQFDRACEKFDAAHRLGQSLGYKLNLADCRRRQGKTATAWVLFREAAAMAEKTGDERAGFARERMAEIEKKLARITLRLSPGAALPGLEIRRDGAVVDRAVLDLPIPVDPGNYLITATAPGHSEWASKVNVGDGAKVAVEVPILGQPTRYRAEPRSAPALVAETAGEEAPPSPGRTQRIVALATGGAGLAAVGVGVAFGLSSRSARNEAHSDGHCVDYQCDQIGFDLVKDAQSAATMSTIFVGVGVAAVGAGVVLYLTAPRGGDAVTVAPVLSADGGSVIVRGAF